MADRQIQDREQTAVLTAFTTAHPLVLVTDFSPEAQGGSAVILRSLLTPEDRERIVWVTLSPRDSHGDDNVVSLAAAGERSLLRDGTTRVRELRDAARRVIAKREASAAWVVAHGASLRVAPSLIASGLPVHITVHDDPAWGWAFRTRRYLGLAPLLAHDLRRSLPRARSVDVVSGAMAQRYRSMYGVESSIVHRGLGDAVKLAPKYSREELSVAVLGTTYGFREMKVLAAALARVQERLGIPVRLSIIGGVDKARVRSICPRNVAVEITGHLDETQGIAKLRNTFLLYLNYPFGRRGKVLRTTSFPTKLSTYVMAARPLLLHMPADSSVAFLAVNAPYATMWSSVDPDEGADIIVESWRNERMDQSFHAAAEAVHKEHFDLNRNKTNLLRALNSLVDDDRIDITAQ